MTKDELLRILLEDDNIELSISAEDDNMSKKYLSQHPYQIWQNKNGRWFSYLPPEEGEKKRKQISSKTREELEKKITKYWSSKEDNPTVEEIFEEWLKFKQEFDGVKPATACRNRVEFNSYFECIRDKKIRNVTIMDIERLMRGAVAKKPIKAKRYSNIRSIAYGIFDMARKMGYVNFRIKDVIADINISKNSFDTSQKPNKEQIFLPEEEAKVVKYLEEHPEPQNLGLLLLFKTGMRIGELVSLKPSDLSGNKIHVSRTESRYVDDDGKVITEVSDSPKTMAGVRDILITDDALWIVKKLRAQNPFGEWLLMKDGKRVVADAMRKRMYRICDKVGVPRKSPHKIRKTYGTKLYDARVPESLICSQMGHTDISCLKSYYYFDMHNEHEKMGILNKVENL